MGFGGTFLGDGGCDRVSLVGESYTFGTSLLQLSCCTSPLSAGCYPGYLCLRWGCPASVMLALWWADCMWVMSSGFCCRPLVGFGGCVAGVVPIWRGLVFSLSLWM